MKKSRESVASGGIPRGLLWRVKLGVLPSGFPSIEELRRAAADGRRRYAELRRRLLVNPHVEEPYKPHHSNKDNPLSLDPESIWGRYFQNAELERTIDKDLTRLYPEHGNFFQSHVCQSMLQRILLVWSLLHPHSSYRQGMHELLAPLLYVLHHDLVNLSGMKHRHKDLFDDRFDEPSPLEPCLLENGEKQSGQSFCSNIAILTTGGLDPDDFGFDLGIMVLGSDTYGAEGELGVLLSRKFVEHDAYSMFDALMSGKGGTVYMADYFLTANIAGSTTGLSPVLEASGTLYRALAVADLLLYNHLVWLGVEPQFFSLRWLRVLFGREFNLGKLLPLWDAIFSVASISESLTGREEDNDSSQPSPRRAFILALALSMLLYLRPTLIAAPSATECLQKLLNFPQNADVSALIDSAKKLKPLVEEVARISPSQAGQFIYIDGTRKIRKSAQRGNSSPFLYAHAVSSTSKLLQPWNASRELLSSRLSESYWEEKWKISVLPKEVPGNVDELTQKIESVVSAMSVQDLADTVVDSKGKGKGSLSGVQANMGIDSEDIRHNVRKTVKTKARSGLSEVAVAHSCSVNNEGTVANGCLDHMKKCSSCSTSSYGIGQTLKATVISQDINGFQGKCNLALCEDLELTDRYFKGRSEPDKRLSPDNGYHHRMKATLSDNRTPLCVTDPGMTDSSGESTQSTLSTKFLIREKVSPGKVVEKSGPARAVLNENGLIDMNSKVQCSTQLVPLESEGTEGISEMPSSVPRSSISPLSPQPRKRFWIWNRCKKTDSGDKMRDSAQSKDIRKQTNIAVTPENSGAGKLFESEKELQFSKDMVTNSDSLLTDTPVRELCSFTCSSLADTLPDGNGHVCLHDNLSAFTPKISSAKVAQFSNLRSLGQSIADNIQVIESALSLMATHGSNESLLVVPRENRANVLTDQMGYEAAHAALMELRKTSQILLQM